jgi:hypothetical protein
MDLGRQPLTNGQDRALEVGRDAPRLNTARCQVEQSVGA